MEKHFNEEVYENSMVKKIIPVNDEPKYKTDPELDLVIKEDEIEEKQLATELQEISDDKINVSEGYDENTALEEFDAEENKEEQSLDSELKVSGEIKEEDDDDLEASEENAGKFEDFYDFKKRYTTKK